MTEISAARLDRALDNLSDEPQVQRNYESYNAGRTGIGIFFGENGDGPIYDWTTFLLALASVDLDLAREVGESLSLDRPSYRGDWYVLLGFTLPADEVSRYEVDDMGDPIRTVEALNEMLGAS